LAFEWRFKSLEITITLSLLVIGYMQLRQVLVVSW